MDIKYGAKYAWTIVQVLPEYPKVHVTFADGTCHAFDFRDLMDSPAFKKLKDPQYFDLVGIVGGALTWPDEADISPEMLYEQATGRSGWS